MSSQGYGVYVNTLCPVAYDLGSEAADFASIYVNDSLMDFFIFTGPEFSDILTAYANTTGFSPKLPKWSYGLWASRAYYKDRTETQAVAEEFRKEKIPCDVISFDCNWFKNGPWICDLKFSDTAFPSPKEMFEQLEADGFKSCVWQLPCVHASLPEYEEGKKKGYFVRKKDGSVYEIKLQLGSIGEQTYGHIDFTNDDAVKWYSEKIKDLLKLGARVVKADMADLCPEDGIYAGVDGREINALFPILYNKLMYNAAQEIYGEGNGVVWARSSYAGGQRYPLVWSGDPFSMFHHMRGSLRGGLSLALSGHVFWSSDIGGYFGQPSETLFIRWAQMGLFLSHSRLHGDTPREPWEYGKQAIEIFRKFDELRYRLLPYIFSMEDKSVKTGIPFIRPLILHHQSDRNVWNICDQYYFGDSMMIAPIMNENGKRKVYLPEGIWYNFWTGKRIEKTGWIEVDVPLDTMPIYIPAGSIIPMGPVMQYVNEKPNEPLEIYVYPGKNNSFHYVNGSDCFYLNIENHNGITQFSDTGLSKTKACTVHIIDGE
jgi:alpha-D-xyloside xylohydrolase